MKKILMIVMCLFILCACASKEKPVPNDKHFHLETYRVDMSGYKGLSSVNHKFEGVSVAEIKRTFDQKGSAVFYLGRTNCPACQEIAYYLNEVAEELGVTVYYIDVNNETYPIVGEAYETLFALLEPSLEKDENGERVMKTPQVFSVINGELVDSHIAIVSSWTTGDPSDKAIKELEDIYRDILMPFAE